MHLVEALHLRLAEGDVKLNIEPSNPRVTLGDVRSISVESKTDAEIGVFFYPWFGSECRLLDYISLYGSCPWVDGRSITDRRSIDPKSVI